MRFDGIRTVAVIGGGVAGSTCAQVLSAAGHAVHVFDKSRGPGGRLATRRVEWADRGGQAHTTRLDHGAVGITANSPAFTSFVEQAVDAGWMVDCMPALAAGSLPRAGGARFYVPVPDMPSLCHRLLEGVKTTWSFPVDKLTRGPLGWQVHAGGEHHHAQFDAVVLAVPPAQAASLLSPHRRDWARHASIVPMQPCWTLMGVAHEPEDALLPTLGWDVAQPPAGPLAWVLRNDARPGRARVPGQAHWVVHARAGWSRRHLDQPTEWVQLQLQAALADVLGRPVDWHHCVAHRWRYALPPPASLAPAEACWWDGSQGLGVCGDFLGGSGGLVVEGVEGAWLSAQSLSAALLRTATRVPHPTPAGADFVSDQHLAA